MLDQEIDQYLGLNCQAVTHYERQNYCDPQFQSSPRRGDTWLGLDAEVLNTSYESFFELLLNLNLPDGSTVVDLGSGLGRLGLVVGLGFPRLRFIGIEYWEHRLRPAQEVSERLGMDHVTFIQGDLTADDFRLPQAEVYFTYLTSSDPESFRKILHKLQNEAFANSLIVARKIRPEIMLPLLPTCEIVKEESPFFLYRLQAKSGSA